MYFKQPKSQWKASDLTPSLILECHWEIFSTLCFFFFIKSSKPSIFYTYSTPQCEWTHCNWSVALNVALWLAEKCQALPATGLELASKGSLTKVLSLARGRSPLLTSSWQAFPRSDDYWRVEVSFPTGNAVGSWLPNSEGWSVTTRKVLVTLEAPDKLHFSG